MSDIGQKLILNLFDRLEDRYRDMIGEDSNSRNLREKDFLTEIDEEMMKLIEEYFRSLDQSFRLVCEEERSFRSNPTDPDYSVIFDSVDASHHLIEGRGSTGPVVAIAEGSEPKFQDVLLAGFLDLKYSRIYYSEKGEGSFLKDEGVESLKTSETDKLREGAGTKILLQQGFLAEYPEIAREAWKHWCADYGSQARHYSMIAGGERDLYITGGHSKIEAKPGNTPEEAAGMYLIVSEAGGAVTDWEGREIGEERIGMEEGKSHDIIAASTPELAEIAAENIIPGSYDDTPR